MREATIISIRIGDRVDHAGRVQNVLTGFGASIVGRIGFPWPDKDNGLIVLVVEAAADEVRKMVEELGKIEHVKIGSMSV